MKKLLLILLCLPILTLAQKTYVPDNNFENYLEANGMGDGIALNDSVFTSAIDTVGYLYIVNMNIADLTGIEDFTDLYYLNCSNNQLTSLDVSQNTSLNILGCGINQLTSLDVSNNTALGSLSCYSNSLTSLDISNNTGLGLLECHANQLTSIDISQNPSLTELFCYSNQLTSLDVNQNTILFSLNCGYNQLTSLDVRNGNNTNFISFYNTNNPNLYCISVDDPVYSTANWTNIDPQHYFSSNCSAMTKTYVPDNNFENYLEANGMGDGIALNDSVFTSAINTVTNLTMQNMNIADLTGIEDFIALIDLNCIHNQLTSIDVSNNTALKYLYLWNNMFTTLDVSNNTALEIFDCDLNQLTTLDVSNNIALFHLDLQNNQITTLDVSNNTALTFFTCSNNQLTTLDVSNNTALIDFFCIGNQLTSLDVRNGNNTNFISFNSINNPNLYCISVDDSAWSSANWTNIDPQQYFNNNCLFVPQTNTPDNNFESYLEANGMGNGILGDDSVSTMNISSVANLNVGGLNIANLTGIEDFSLLQYLDCSNNNLTDLDVSNNAQLSNLQCEANILNTLSFDVGLTSLDCFNNQLTSLDLSNNPNLTFLNCSYNNLNWLDLRNGNNQSLINPNFTGNPYLSCIAVEDPPTSGPDWPWDDPWSVYSTSCDPINSWNCVGNDCLGDSTGQGTYTVLGDCQANCGVSSVLDNNNSAKELIKIIDVLGRHTAHTKEIILFYIYDDGTVEKRITIE